MNAVHADRISGALGMLLAATYVWQARGIEDSLLADAVGAAGVPTGVGVVLFLASLLLFVKSRRSGSGKPVETPSDGNKPAPEGAAHPHRIAAGLLMILVGYVALLPLLGYVVAIGLLVGSVAWFGGARRLRSIVLCVLLSGPILWLLFDCLLEIRVPVGLWSKWLVG